MGRSQRTKGQTGEREVCHILSEHFDAEIKRHIGQARDGGLDIDLGIYGIEVKRRKTLGTLREWMAQVKKAVRFRQTPVVIAREDNGEWMVVLPLQAWLDNLKPDDYNYIHGSFAKQTQETEN